AEDAARDPRARRPLLRLLPRALLLWLRALLPGARAGRRRLPRPPDGPDGDRGGELLLPHAEVPRAGPGALRGRARAHHAGRLPARGAGHAARADRRSLNVATRATARLGCRPA